MKLWNGEDRPPYETLCFIQSQIVHTVFYTILNISHCVLYNLRYFTLCFIQSQIVHTVFCTILDISQRVCTERPEMYVSVIMGISYGTKYLIAQWSNAVLLFADPRVDGQNHGRANQINHVSKFSSICKSLTLVNHYTGRYHTLISLDRLTMVLSQTSSNYQGPAFNH